MAIIELLDAIEQLPSPQERLVIRKVMAGLEPAAIASELKLSRSNVDTIKSRAIPKLRHILNGGDANA